MQRTFLEGLISDATVVDAILQEHQRSVDAMEFQHSLQQAVQSAGGRNFTAIRALLDEQALLAGENRQQAIASALQQLKKDSPYLFEGSVPQPYAAGAAAQVGQGYSMEDMGAMSMAEYRRFRKGMGR